MTHILVVEDSRTQRHLIARWLVKKNFQVTTVRDGLEALKQIRKQPPDIVLLDVVMPHMNGYEICRFLKSNRRTEQIRVILCSTKSTQIDRYWGLKQGADAYLCKPFKSKELLQTILRLVPPPTAT
ncbi:MAG: response regulator [Spirulina sp. SIO3F2]|nr:response regulator [Spirulina sp. SIO3F2]